MRPITMQMAQFKVETQEGNILNFKNCKGGYFSKESEYGLKVFGNSVQADTPTINAPIEVESVGELMTQGEHLGEYKVDIKVAGDSDESTVSVYLSKPLRRIEGSNGAVYTDYIDWAQQKVVRYVHSVNLSLVQGWQSWVYNERFLGFYFWMGNDYLECKAMSNYFKTQAINHLPDSRDNSVYSKYGSVYIGTDTWTTTKDFKAWLAEKNVMLYCARSTPIEEGLSLPKLKFTQGTCNVCTITNVPASLNATAFIRR